MNKRRKFFSGYSIFCIVWSALSLAISLISVLIRIFGDENFNKVSGISIIPGINAGTFIVASSIYFLAAAIYGRHENKNKGSMTTTSVISCFLSIFQIFAVVIMYSSHKINLRIYVQAIVTMPFLIVAISIMMSERSHLKHTVSGTAGKRTLFSRLDKLTRRKDISQLLKPRGARKRRR